MRFFETYKTKIAVGFAYISTALTLASCTPQRSPCIVIDDIVSSSRVEAAIQGYQIESSTHTYKDGTCAQRILLAATDDKSEFDLIGGSKPCNGKWDFIDLTLPERKNYLSKTCKTESTTSKAKILEEPCTEGEMRTAQSLLTRAEIALRNNHTQ